MATATITLLFCDLVGSTDLLSRLGEDEAERIRRACFKAFRDAVAAHEGDEVKSLGDGLMVAFTSVPNALTAAVAMQQAVEDLNRREGTPALELRIGVSTGEADHADNDWFGRPVVEASRLCEAAASGQILVSELARTLAGGRGGHHYRAHEPLALKGFPDAVAAVEVAWEPIDLRSLLPETLTATDAGAFVGRRPELDLLQQCWKHAAGGSPRAALISGEPGIGKTRLAGQFAGWAVGEGATVLYGRCDEDLGIPYQPFVEALRDRALSLPPATLLEQAGRWAPYLVRLVPELTGALPEPDAPPPTEPEAERYLLFDAVTRWLAATSSEAPLLLVLDDLHWADRPTLLLLRHVLRCPEAARLLVVGAWRETGLDPGHPLTGLLADLRRDAPVERVRLAGLDEEFIAEMVHSLGPDTLDREAHDVVERLHVETGGNPFFVTELLGHMAHTGSLRALPESLREVLSHRVGQLSDTARRMLEGAATVGVDFAPALVERALAGAVDPGRFVDAVDEAVHAGLLVERGPGRMAFAHELVRRSIIESLTAARRAHLHRVVGEALEATAGEESLGALAFHFAEAATAGEGTRAADYALRAGRQALGQAAYEHASEVLQRGLHALELDAPSDRGRRCDLLLARAEALYHAGLWGELAPTALQAAEDAAALESPERLATAAVLFLEGAPLGVDRSEVHAIADAAIDALGSGASALRARLLASLGRWPTRGTPTAPEYIADESVRLAREAGDSAALASGLLARATVLRLTGKAREELDVAEELLALAARTGNPFMRARGLVDRGRCRLTLGDADGFDADVEELDRVGRDLGGQYRSWADMHRTVRALLDGRFDDAERLAQVHAELPHPDALNVYAGHILVIRRDQGRLEEILPLVEQAVVDNPGLAAFRAALALTHAEVGDAQEARRHLEVLAEDDFGRLPFDTTHTGTVALLAEVCERLGDAERAAALEHHLLPHAGLLVVVAETVAALGAADRFLGMLAAVQGRHDDADDRFSAAADLERRVGSRPLLARTCLAHARSRVAIGDRDGATRMLDEATDAAQAVGMAGVMAEIEEMR